MARINFKELLDKVTEERFGTKEDTTMSRKNNNNTATNNTVNNKEERTMTMKERFAAFKAELKAEYNTGKANAYAVTVEKGIGYGVGYALTTTKDEAKGVAKAIAETKVGKAAKEIGDNVAEGYREGCKDAHEAYEKRVVKRAEKKAEKAKAEAEEATEEVKAEETKTEEEKDANGFSMTAKKAIVDYMFGEQEDDAQYEKMFGMLKDIQVIDDRVIVPTKRVNTRRADGTWTKNGKVKCHEFTLEDGIWVGSAAYDTLVTNVEGYDDSVCGDGVWCAQ